MENEIANEKAAFPLRKAVTITVIVVLLASVVGLNVYRANNKDLIAVKTVEVKQKALVETVLASGKISAPEKEVIYSRVTGSVKRINVKMGQDVKPGQVLMEIDIPDAQQKILQARSSLAEAEASLAKIPADGRSTDLVEAQALYEKAKSDFALAQEKLKRNQALFSAGVISSSDMESVQADFNNKQSDYQRSQSSYSAAQKGSPAALNSVKSSVQAAREALLVKEQDASQQNLTATIAGKVMSIPVQKGDWVAPNTLLISVGKLSILKVNADIAEGDAGKMIIGQTATITASALPDQQFKGNISEVGLEAVSKSKNQGESTTIPVVVTINGSSKLRPGYNVDLKIKTAEDKNALVVPFEALVEKKDKTCVYVIRDSKAHLQKVKTGISDNTHIQVITGLKKGEKVVINPAPTLKDGSEVKAQ